MVFSNIKSRQQERGFTIVELLIVIVVIGILAGITIVAYSGITNRANLSKIQANATSVQSVAEAMNADNGFYPGLANPASTCPGTLTALSCGSTSTKLPTGVAAVPDNITTSPITSASGTATVAYACLTACAASTGGRITYWDPVAGAKAYVYVGAATSGGTFVAPAS
jgi:prepilin-type N-terminal cleavage/methylation domain-containing protein